MRFRFLMVLGILAALVVTGCDQVGAAEEPTDAVQRLVETIADKDFEQASEYLCEARRGEFEQAIEGSFVELEQMGLERDELLQTFEINLENVNYEELSQEGDTAVVGVTGTMSVSFDEEELGNFVRQAAEASGEEVSDEQLDSLVQMLVQAGEQAQPIDSEVELVRENDEWLVCDDLDFLNQTGVLQLP